MSGMSLQKAGELFDRDHATVIHGIENILTAYEGYGHIELVDIINTINDNRLTTIFKSDDSNINYAISQVILDLRYSELNF
jgi:glutamate formiminotransferase